MSDDAALEDSMLGDDQTDVSVSQAPVDSEPSQSGVGDGGAEEDGDALEESKVETDEAAPEDGAVAEPTNPTTQAETAGELKEDEEESSSPAAPAAGAPPQKQRGSSISKPADAPLAPQAARTASVTRAAMLPAAAGGMPLSASETADAASAASAAEIQRRIAAQARRREEELARQKMEEEKEFPPGFHYSDDSDELARYLKPFELSREYINLHASFGYACQVCNTAPHRFLRRRVQSCRVWGL
jgi:hypothetical protein